MTHKFLLGEWRDSPDVMEVCFPYDGSLVDSVYLATPQDLEDTINSA